MIHHEDFIISPRLPIICDELELFGWWSKFLDFFNIVSIHWILWPASPQLSLCSAMSTVFSLFSLQVLDVISAQMIKNDSFQWRTNQFCRRIVAILLYRYSKSLTMGLLCENSELPITSNVEKINFFYFTEVTKKLQSLFKTHCFGICLSGTIY